MSDFTPGQGYAVQVAGSVSIATGGTLNITADAVVKAGAGRVIKFNVLVAGSGAGAIHDAGTTGGAASANQIAVIPQTVGIYTLEWPVSNGIVIKIGTGQTVAVSYT